MDVPITELENESTNFSPKVENQDMILKSNENSFSESFFFQIWWTFQEKRTNFLLNRLIWLLFGSLILMWEPWRPLRSKKLKWIALLANTWYILLFKIPYARHHNPLFIINRSWILTIHKARILWKKPLKKRFWPSKSG